MLYLPAIDLWNTATIKAIESGQLKLQRGQWVKCGSDKLGRYVGTKGSHWVAHWQGSKEATNKRFKDLCEAF